MMENISLIDLSQLFERLAQAWEEGDFDRVSDVLPFSCLFTNTANELHYPKKSG